MADKKEDEETPKVFWVWLWRSGSVLLISLVTWLGSYISKEYTRMQEASTAMGARIAELEQDKAKWATLANLENQQLQMKIQLEVMRQVWGWQYQREIPTGFPPRAGHPDLKAPEELFRDIDRYRSMQQQKVAPR